MSDDSKERKTSYLGTPRAQPMPEREQRKDTTRIGIGSKLQIKIGDKKAMVDIADEMLVGRLVEGDDTTGYAIDLGPYGGYQSGVSRRHAMITRHEGGLYIEDLGSTNGTRINGFQLTVKRKYRLRDGDEVEFARLRTQVRFIHEETTPESEESE